MNDIAKTLADKLEQVLLENEDHGAILENSQYFVGELEGCFHGLQHFYADEDIRGRDVVYREMQESEMRKIIAMLRSGVGSNALSSIHFLGESR